VSAGPFPCVCLVTDRRQVSPDARTVAAEIAGLERWLDDAIDAGVDLIQIRERDLPASVLAACAARVLARARQGRTRVAVNDRVDVALAVGADGVHLPESGLPVAAVRALAPPGWTVGRSVHAVSEAAAEAHAGATYLLFGTVFPSTSKPPDAPVQGLKRLQAAVAASVAPVVGIGGITPERARLCAAAGAAGVAAIGLFLPEGRGDGAIGPVRATRALRAAFDGQARPASRFAFPIPPC